VRHPPVVVLSALLALSGCGQGEELGWCDHPRGTDDSIFAGNTFRDWRGHGHHLAVVRITRIKRDKAPPGAEPWDTGLPVSTLRVERVVWSAPSAPRLPRVLRFRRISELGAGRRYLMVLTHYETDPVRWGPLACSGLLLDEDGRTADAYYTGPRGLEGKTPEEVAAMLGSG
jgi:hypothetical protein